MSKPSPQLNALNDTPFQSSPAFGQLPSKSDATTPPQEYPGSYSKRAKGKTPRLEALLKELESFAVYHPEYKGFVCTRFRGGHARKIGENLGSINGAGYKTIHFQGSNQYEHCLIWIWMTGEWPQAIDHIDGDRSNNKWENLREATPTENRKNCRKNKNNTSGVSNIYWRKRERKWMVSFMVNYKAKNYGYYNCIKEAVRIRNKAAKELGFTDRHGE